MTQVKHPGLVLPMISNLDVTDSTPTSNLDLNQMRKKSGIMGGGHLRYAPRQVKSSAPVYGSLTENVELSPGSNFTLLQLTDQARDAEAGASLYKVIQSIPKYARLWEAFPLGTPGCVAVPNSSTYCRSTSPISTVPYPNELEVCH